MAADNQLMKSLALSNRGKNFPVLSMVKSNTEMAAMVSKMVTPMQPSKFGKHGERELDAPNTQSLRELASSTARGIEDSRTVLTMLPDIELSAQILVSSIISPKDMMSTELIYMAPEEILPSAVSQALLTKLRVHFDQVYKIKPQLNQILRDILVETGSYVVAVLPENSIDDVINRHTAVTMESISTYINPQNGEFHSMGLLGGGTKEIKLDAGIQEKTMLQIAQESFSTYNFTITHDTRVHAVETDANGQELNRTLALEGVTVTDNLNVLKYPALQERIRTQRVYQAINQLTGVRKNLDAARLGIAQESRSQPRKLVGQERKLTDREITAAVYRAPHTGYTPITVMRTQEQLKRRTVGNPLIMHLPSESVIPVHVPGQEEKHVGYFVLVDSLGNPLSSKSKVDYQDLAQKMNASSSQSMPSQLLQRVKMMTNGANCSDHERLDYSVRAYGDIIEQDLMARLRNGVYNNGVALARNEEVYRIMLARTLARQQTQLLFLPVELVTYFAFRYNPDGIGKSLLDDMRVLNSLRAMTMFADVMASIRNSVGLVDVKVKLDEDDGDPKKTIELVQDEFLRARQQSFPLGINSPVDITKWLQRAGISFSWESHPGLPDINVDISEKSTNYVKPDSELTENLRKQAIMGFGLNPETVDTAFNGEFATSVMNNNLLLSRRVLQYQERFTPQLTDHLVKVAMASQYLVEDMRGVINEAYEDLKINDDEAREIVGNAQDLRGRMVDHLLSQFMCGLNIGLPKPDTVTIENQKESYDGFVELLDKVLNDAWMSPDFMTSSMMGNVGERGAEIKAAVRAHFIREWLSENGVMTEVSALTATDEDGKPKLNVWDSQAQHMEGLVRALANFMVKTEEVRNDANKVLEERVKPQESSGGFGGGFGGSGDSFGNPGGGGGDEFGVDEFGTPGGGEGNPDATQNPDENPEGNPENPDETQNPEDEEGQQRPPAQPGSPEASLR